MLGLLLFLTVPSLVALLLGLGLGWLTRRTAWGRILVGGLALALPPLSLAGYLKETALAAERAPQGAGVWQLFQAETALLLALVGGLTLLGAWRAARWSPLPLLTLFPVFYKLVLPPIFGDGNGPYDELLSSQLDGDTNRGLLLFCLCGAALLAGMLLAGRSRP